MTSPHYKTEENNRVRVAALWHEGLGMVRVKVIFRDAHNTEYAYWMDRVTYDAIPLMQRATVSDYRTFGHVDPALNTDIYSNL